MPMSPHWVPKSSSCFESMVPVYLARRCEAPFPLQPVSPPLSPFVFHSLVSPTDPVSLDLSHQPIECVSMVPLILRAIVWRDHACSQRLTQWTQPWPFLRASAEFASSCLALGRPRTSSRRHRFRRQVWEACDYCLMPERERVVRFPRMERPAVSSVRTLACLPQTAERLGRA